ncbi:MAG: winged helix-turn-helix transcriptional regulator [Actinomycetes bacterium]
MVEVSSGTDQDPGSRLSGGGDRVAASLLTEGPATAAALAVRLGISATAVRRHLDTLMADDLVEAAERPPYGPTPRRGRGRPARVFSLTANGRATFPSRYDDLASSALGFLNETAGPGAVAAFAKARADELGRDLVRGLGPDWRQAPPDEQVGSLARALSELGYAASAEPAPAGTQLCQHHCPVAHVAEQFPQLCEAETAVFAEVLGRHVQRLATIAHGDGVCTTVVQRHQPMPSDERNSA